MARPFDKQTNPDLTEGMEVRGSDASPLGYVRGIRDIGFLLYRPSGVFLVPFTAVQSISSSGVVLQATGEKLGEMGCTMVEATPMPSSPLGK